PSIVTEHAVTVAWLTISKTYHNRVKSNDTARILAQTPNSTLTPYTTPFRSISGIAVTSVGGTSATIQWTTNEASDSQVEYGLTASYGSATTLDPTLGTSHTVAVGGLTGSTIYHYRVKSKDASGNLAASADSTFTTSDI